MPFTIQNTICCSCVFRVIKYYSSCISITKWMYSNKKFIVLEIWENQGFGLIPRSTNMVSTNNVEFCPGDDKIYILRKIETKYFITFITFSSKTLITAFFVYFLIINAIILFCSVRPRVSGKSSHLFWRKKIDTKIGR